MQKGNSAVTHLNNGTIVTDAEASYENAALSAQGYTIRHIETWHGANDQTCIVWDRPEINEAEIPY